MKESLDELVEKANFIAIARLLLRQSIIDISTYNKIINKIDFPS